MKRVLVVGCGDVGLRVARLHLARGDTVTGIVRSENAAAGLASVGLVPWVVDLDAGPPEFGNRRFDIVHHHAPPPPSGTRDTRIQYLLDTLPPPRRFVLLSATSVYGDHGGSWVNEDTSPAPTTDRGRRRLDAETWVLDWTRRTGCHAVILRVAAIYGPGRLPLERLRAGTVAIRPEEAHPTNRIHADDLASVCLAATESGQDGAVYNCADGHPTTQAEFLTDLARIAGLPPPELVTRAEAEQRLPESMLSFLRDGKLIRPDRMQRELGVTLRYSDHRAGLEATLSGRG